MGRIVATSPGLGKTTFAKENPSILNLDPVTYKYFGMESLSPEEVEMRKGDKSRETNPDYPNNFIRVLKENTDKYDIVLIHAHVDVLRRLRQDRLEYTLVYPTKEFFNGEILNRYKDRGNTDTFVNKMLGDYERDYPDCTLQEVIWVDSGYLSEVLSCLQSMKEKIFFYILKRN